MQPHGNQIRKKKFISLVLIKELKEQWHNIRPLTARDAAMPLLKCRQRSDICLLTEAGHASL